MTQSAPAIEDIPIRIGISACLLGKKVRYDGGHKRDDFLVDTFGKFVQWVPVCPEVELGMGTPRDPIRLVQDGSGLRMIQPKTGAEYTAPMQELVRKRAKGLAEQGLSGFVLKKDSPTCGMERVKVYDRNGSPSRTGVGFFAAALLERYPELPVEEEGRLNDPRLRDNFVERVFAYRRLQQLFSGRWSAGAVVKFHTAHKLMLMAHSPTAYQALGRLVARARELGREAFRDTYRSNFMEALRRIATPRLNTNVLQHMAGYFKKSLDEASRREIQESIEEYRRQLVPLIVPLTLLRHHVRAQGIAYLEGQIYLQPHPRELMLRNHV